MIRRLWIRARTGVVVLGVLACCCLGVVVIRGAVATAAGGSSVSDVTFGPSPGPPGAFVSSVSWNIGFTTSSTGALTTGDTITVAFNPSFQIPFIAANSTPLTLVASTESGFVGDGGLTATAAANVVTLTLVDGESVAPETQVILTLGPIGDPAPGTYAATSFSVSTSVDTTPASPSADVVVGPPSNPIGSPSWVPTAERIAGPDAIGTALAVSWAEFPRPDSANAVVLARDDFFSDAIAGGPLAAYLGGPLLVTAGASQTNSLDPRVQAEIERVLPMGRTVYILGGDLAVSPSIDTTLEGLGYQVVREAGANEYATAVDIAEAMGNPTTIFEATGLSFYDALSAAPAAIERHGAILLTDGSTQSYETGLYLLSNPGDTRYAIGGPLAAAGADSGATAIYGPDLYGTSVAVAKRFFPVSPEIWGAATTSSFSDAAAGGVFMATGGRLGPILLAPQGGSGGVILNYLLDAGAPSEAPPTYIQGYAFGGPLAIADSVLDAMVAAPSAAAG
jgi:putative cell wall-binding protein